MGKGAKGQGSEHSTQSWQRASACVGIGKVGKGHGSECSTQQGATRQGQRSTSVQAQAAQQGPRGRERTVEKRQDSASEQ